HAHGIRSLRRARKRRRVRCGGRGRHLEHVLRRSGTYQVTALVSWERANDQANVGFVDNIDEGTRTNGTAVLKIAFSDGSSGVLTVGCHGPGAPPGIFEGIATTKGYKTYYNVPAPVSGVDAGRTIFHVRSGVRRIEPQQGSHP